jgi:ketosteroid isomerase-like protein
MSEPDPRAVALAFVAAINARDVDRIAALMTEDHEFIDIPGQSFHGREPMREGWIGYYRLFPDYQIEVDRVLASDDAVTLIGSTTGTLSEFGREALRRAGGTLPGPDELQGPALWTARIQGDMVARWRVYWDTPDTRAALAIPDDDRTAAGDGA